MRCTFIILGITGDLAKKKIIPALYRMLAEDKIEDIAVIGVGRRETNPKEIIENSRKFMGKVNEKALSRLISKTHYFRTNFEDMEGMKKLGIEIDTIEKKQNTMGNRIFYLATVPEHFEDITRSIRPYAKNAKVIFEKPFGYDLASAKKMNRCIKSVFNERQIYRIDHYLGKELVQGLSILRFSNIVFEPIWNNKYIDNVEVIISEDFGVEDRIEFYDRYGAIKDVVQNHMLQLVALVGMEKPKYLNGEYIRDEKMKVLNELETKLQNPKK